MSDLLPATDGLLLGSDTKRWDASKLINIAADKITSGQLSDARFLNALLLDGSRVMAGNLDFAGNEALKVSKINFPRSATIPNTPNTIIRGLWIGGGRYAACVRKYDESDYAEWWCKDLYIVSLNWNAIDSYLRAGTGTCYYTAGNPAQVVARQDGLVATSPYWSIPRAGDIDILEDKFIKIGRDSDGTLPTADSSYRGKMTRVEGGAGEADRLYVCMKSAADTYSWVQIGSG